ncbi:MAG TPA: xanthine dehydrogenase family protein molybdopterin-binding subunit [Vicinamibacteria bacterium]|nr:xanthine dehydrogenase family protein molybdopterin-binding subunit [Vicinamibacteria bacterium]
MDQLNAVGRSVLRPDGLAKVTGRALYLDDLPENGCWHGTTVRSPHASALILSVDSSAVSDPEVRVLTAKDVGARNSVHLIHDDWPILADGRVNHVGEPIALVAAPTLARAQAAAKAIKVAWEAQTPVLELDAALRGDPRTGGRLNVLAKCDVQRGDVDAGFGEAEVIVEGWYTTGHQEHVYIEPHGVIATPALGEGGAFLGVDVVGSLQCPFYVHQALTHLFDLAGDAIRVRQSVTGGGFGGKEDYPDMIAAHASLLARACGKAVKIVYERQEDIIATTKRHPSRVRHRTGVKRDGTLVAMDIDVLLDGGAYITLSPVVLSRSVLHAAGAYSCPNVRIRGRVLATNTPPNGAFRGFGAPQSLFAVERQMDKVARTLGLDPFEARIRNAYRQGDITPTGQVLKESVSAVAVLERAKTATRFAERFAANEAARAGRKDDGRPLHGIGLSVFWHGSGFTGNGERRMMSKGAVRLRPDLKIEVLSSSTDFGQGTESVFRQIVADASGVTLDDVVVHVPDTAAVPDSGPTVASRTVMVVGRLLARAGAKLAETLRAFAAHQSGTAPAAVVLSHGFFETERGRTPFAEVAKRYVTLHGPLDAEATFEPTPGSTFDEATYQGDAYAAYGWGANVVEVEVDPDTFITRLTKLTTVSDVGHVVHPVMCAGQVEGGTLQALGWGYLEEMKMKDGRFLNDRMQTYLIPTMADAPDMETILLENPTTHGPFGAKGVGELPMDGGAPALLQAIENATGIALSAIPATPERIFEASRARKRS